jgi:hypothetical protein
VTKDEILALVPGRELDALAGMAMGLEVYRSKEDWMQKRMPHIAEWSSAVSYPAYWHPKYELATVVPSYSTDISAAWEVRQWLMDHIGGVSLISVCDDNSEFCELYQGKDKKEIKIRVRAKTVPEAICKVALLAMEAE